MTQLEALSSDPVSCNNSMSVKGAQHPKPTSEWTCPDKLSYFLTNTCEKIERCLYHHPFLYTNTYDFLFPSDDGYFNCKSINVSIGLLKSTFQFKLVLDFKGEH